MDIASNSKYTSFINRLNNNGHKKCISITVAGEIIQKCLIKSAKYDVHDIVDYLKNNDFEIFPATDAVRQWCPEVDLRLEPTYGSSVTDRTHLAYALANEATYFVTSSGEVRSLGGKDMFSDSDLKIVTLDELKKELNIR